MAVLHETSAVPSPTIRRSVTPLPIPAGRMMVAFTLAAPPRAEVGITRTGASPISSVSTSTVVVEPSKVASPETISYRTIQPRTGAAVNFRLIVVVSVIGSMVREWTEAGNVHCPSIQWTTAISCRCSQPSTLGATNVTYVSPSVAEVTLIQACPCRMKMSSLGRAVPRVRTCTRLELVARA